MKIIFTSKNKKNKAKEKNTRLLKRYFYIIWPKKFVDTLTAKNNG